MIPLMKASSAWCAVAFVVSIGPACGGTELGPV